MKALRILVADDHDLIRRGVRTLLEAHAGWEICAEASTGREAVAKAKELEPDIAILDISMPGRSGLDVLRDLKAARPKLPVLVLSMHPEDQYGKRMLSAGAAGYMNKESAPEELVKAVRKVLAGGRYVSAALAEKLASDMSEDAGRPLHEALSHREFEILRMIGAGRAVSQIAGELHLGVTTVSTYRARILIKMHMTTTAELMHYALHNRLLD